MVVVTWPSWGRSWVTRLLENCPMEELVEQNADMNLQMKHDQYKINENETWDILCKCELNLR